MTYRVVATDLDGTLLRGDGTVSDRTRAALRRVRAAGASLVFVTGRPARWMSPVVATTGYAGPAICANGALELDLGTGVVGRTRLLDPGAGRSFATALRERLPGVAFAVETLAGFGHEPGYPTTAQRAPVPGELRVATVDVLCDAPVVKLLARHPVLDADELLATARGLGPGWQVECTHSSLAGLLEVSGAGVGKAAALARWCADRGVGADAVLAFGDMPNDVGMLAWAGHSVAVAGAHPEALAVADEVTGANDADGVAAVLEREFPGYR